MKILYFHSTVNKSTRSKQKTIRENGFQSMGSCVLCEKHIALRFSIQNIASLSLSAVLLLWLGHCVFQRHPQGNISRLPSSFFYIYFAVSLLLRYLKSLSLFARQLRHVLNNKSDH